MSKPNGRRVRMEEFRQQVAEVVLPPDGKVGLDLGDGVEVAFVVPLNLDEDDPYVLEIQGAKDEDDLARVVLGAEQLETVLHAGYSTKEFAVLFAAESRAAAERMEGFRYRPSGK